MNKIVIIKIGGNVIDDEQALAHFLQQFARLDGAKILVHGGGKLATAMAQQLGIEQMLIDGRRVTDKDTLRIVTMVYAGYINKTIVAALQGLNCNAVGLTGADGNLVAAHKRTTGDFGYVGDVDDVDTAFIQELLSANKPIVLAPITHDKKGQLLNTNADTIAQAIATALTDRYEVHLIYCFEKEGVLLHADDASSVIPHLNNTRYHELKKEGSIYAGMIPKLDAAFSALQHGVSRVVIGSGDNITELISGTKGTTISHE